MTAAQPVEGSVYCEECGAPHDAIFEGDKGFLVWHDPDECPVTAEIVETGVQELPENWDREFIAQYGQQFFNFKTGKHEREFTYNLYPKNPPLMEFHRPMYYLEGE